MKRIVKADLTDPRHAQALIDLLNTYALDPAGGGKALPAHIKDNLVPALLEREGIHVFLAFMRENAAGLLIGMEGFSTFACKPLLNIHDLIVAPEYRGKGISSLLLQASEDLAIEKGCCKLTLEVLEKNEIAKSIYTRFGFRAYALNPDMGRAMFWQKAL